jgi:hypothetical protein
MPNTSTGLCFTLATSVFSGPRKDGATTSTKPLAGLDPAIGYPHQFANDVIQFSNHPMGMAGWSPAMTWLDRCVWYVNS